MKKTTIILLFLCASFGYGQNDYSLVDSLKTELKSVSHDTVRIRRMFRLADAYSLSKPDSAFYYADKISVLSNKIKYKKGQTNVLGLKAFLNREIGNLALALDFGFKALASARQNNQPVSEMTCYNLLGIVYLDLNDYKKAISYYRKARKIAVKREEWKRVYGYDSNTAGAFIKMGVKDSAGFYLERAKNGKQRTAKDIPDIFLTRNLGNYETMLGNYDKALAFYSQAMAVAGKNVDYRNQASTYNKIAKVYEFKKQTDSVIYNANNALNAAKKGPFRIMILEAATILASAYQSKGDYKQAFEIQKLKEKIQEELYGTNNIKSIQEAILREQTRATELQQNQIAYQNKLKLYAFTGGLAVMLVVAGLLFRNNRQKQKSNRQLSDQKQKLQVTLEELKATQSQLIQSEKMASLGELTAGIAHEIQNPLNFVNNFSEISNEMIDEILVESQKSNVERDADLINDNLSDIKQNLEKINHHGKRADAIVKGMLQHSRTNSGMKELTDVNALADEYLRLAYHGLRAKDKSFNATLETDFDESIGKIEVVPQDIGRVILNLITNAFHTVDEKKKSGVENYNPTVAVSTKKDGNSILISVKDNGSGIPDAIKDKIFQPFFTTKPTGEGTGLGLSLAYDIVKAHGGELKVMSDKFEGTTFSILLHR